ncbi:hypothetical protein EUGRSUZ_G03067 [Eucalyptus grandis]|uniref:Uncharacterized protein n=2 Tax=Eucalyptus grandis TaxID=71139 RepID=A0ACC3K8T0_EUCGR|nr:hypothetical protein EUGRSUZ_G03067 [Eucalyptus grandis]
MEGESYFEKDEKYSNCSILLELSASDDLPAFERKAKEKGCNIDGASFWYGRRIGSRKMGLEERTPLMVASLFGSSRVVKYILESGKVDVNRACGSDKVTALHCAVASGSASAVEVVKLLLHASADANCIDGNGKKPIDVIALPLKSRGDSRRKLMELLLKGDNSDGEFESHEEKPIAALQASKEGSEKKEYQFPVDISLPDINVGIYSTDEFRMYAFKVKPCSRAYSHDWTECPFVHPGENARRRDPRKYPYSCVPCPEFRKGSCQKGDSCEYAHGVFESWLHPAQYRTRLCKDETGCARKVCFFAHKPEELRPVYASTGSAMPSPKSYSSSGLDMSTLSPLSISSPSASLPVTSTAPMSPLAASSSPMSVNMWQSKANKLSPPMLQLSGSRLKTALSARDLDLEMELRGLESQMATQQHQLMEEISRLSSPSSCFSSRIGEVKPTNLDDVFGSPDPALLPQLQGLSRPSTPSQLQSPTGLQMRQNATQFRGAYQSNANALSSPAMKQAPSYGFDSSSAVAAAVMNSRSAAFAKRSQSFIDRGMACPGIANSSPMMSSAMSSWSSPHGKLDWGVQGDELNRLRKAASFKMRSSTGAGANTVSAAAMADEPDISWVSSLVKDVPSAEDAMFAAEKGQRTYGKDIRERITPWVEQLYREVPRMAM